MTTLAPNVPYLDGEINQNILERDEKMIVEHDEKPSIEPRDEGLTEPVVESRGDPSWKTWQNNTAKSWWKDKGLRRCMFDIVLLFGSIFANGYDSGVMSSLQANHQWIEYFNAPTGQRLGGIVSAYSFRKLRYPQDMSHVYPTCSESDVRLTSLHPAAVNDDVFFSFPLLGSFLGDRFGRKPVIAVASALGIMGPLLSGLGHSLGTFVGGRIITGVACAFFQVTAPPLIAEIAHPRFRAVVSATYLCTYYVGAFIVSWVGYGMVLWGGAASWRVITCLQCLGCLPLVIWAVLPWMSESPRYLVKKGQQDKALKTLADLHANGDEKDELVVNEFHEIVKGIELDALAQTSSYSDFFKTPGNKKRFWLVVWFSWAQSMSGNNLFAYYLPLIFEIAGFTNFLNIQALSGGLVLFLLFVGLASAQLVERVGRRPLLLISLTGLVFGFVLLTALTGSFAHTGDKSTGVAVIPIIFLALAFYVAAMVPLPYLYVSEILPYHLRSKGLAIFSILTAMGQVYNAYVNAIALAAIAWKYYIIFIITDVIQVVVAYFIVIETKGLTLEDIAILFDGPAVVTGGER